MRNIVEYIYKVTMAATTRVLVALLTCALLTGCRDNDIDDDNPEDINGNRYIQLQIKVDDGGQTRAGDSADDNPNGGESGNTHEDGYEYEKTVNNAILLLYQTTTDADIQKNAEEITVSQVLVFPEFISVTENSKTYWKSTTAKIIDYLPVNQDHHAIVIANVNNIDNLAAQMRGKTLAQIRDMKLETDPWYWNNDVKLYLFAMSSRNDDIIRIPEPSTAASSNYQGGNGTSEENAYIVGNIEVERLAARIDISPSPAANSSSPGWNSVYVTNYNSVSGQNGYLFRVDDGKTTSNTESDYDHFLLTGVEVRNVPISTFGTYFIRRTICYDDENKEVKEYFGKDASGNTSTKWVISPWTVDMRNNFKTSAFLAETNIYSAKYKTEEKTLPAPSDLFDARGLKYFLATYTTENTFLSRNTKGDVYYTKEELTRFATKIVFKGTYYSGVNPVTKQYEYIIRHSDPSGAGDITSPMLYGIVRNNIYRIAIKKIVNSDISMIQSVVWYYGSGSSGSIEHIKETVNIEEAIGNGSSSDNGFGDYPADAPRRK